METEEMQDRRDTDNRMQDSWDAEQLGCRIAGMQDWRGAGKVGHMTSMMYRRVGIQDKWDEGRGMQVKRDAKRGDYEKVGFKIGRIQDWRDT